MHYIKGVMHNDKASALTLGYGTIKPPQTSTVQTMIPSVVVKQPQTSTVQTTVPGLW